MTVDVITGEVVDSLSATQARDLTDRIRSTLTVAHDLIVQAYQGRAWTALGYESWDSYCAGEFGDARMVRLDREQRREIVADMRQAGMSTPAISSATGIPQSTVYSDLPELVNRGVPLPDKIQRTDGTTRAAASKPPVEPAAPRPVRQRALTDQFFDASYDLSKAIDRIERLAAEDRFVRNAEQVAAKHRNDLSRAADVLADVLARLP